MNASSYHQTRLPPDPRRRVLWTTLWRFYLADLLTRAIAC